MSLFRILRMHNSILTEINGLGQPKYNKTKPLAVIASASVAAKSFINAPIVTVIDRSCMPPDAGKSFATFARQRRPPDWQTLEKAAPEKPD